MMTSVPSIDADRVAAWLPDRVIALAGGLGSGLWIAAGQFGPLLIVGLFLVPFLAGRAVASSRLVVLAVGGAIGPPLLASMTFDLWCRDQGSAAAWFGFGLILWIGILAVATPVAFLLGRQVAGDVDDPQPLTRIFVAISAIVGIASWSVFIALNATNQVCSA